MERDILGTALRVVEELSLSGDPVGVRELSRSLDMTVGSTHRILQALKRERLVEQAGKRGQYCSGSRLVELAGNLLRSDALVHAATPIIRRTADETGESVVVMVADGDEAVCVASAEGAHLLRVVFPAGWRGPLQRGASGRVLLAHQSAQVVRAVLRGASGTSAALAGETTAGFMRSLAAIRRHGYAVSHGERSEGFTSIAAAVHGPDCAALASVALYGASARFEGAGLRKHVTAVRACASAITASIAIGGYRQPMRRRS